MPLKIKRHPLLATHSILAVTAFLGSVSKEATVTSGEASRTDMIGDRAPPYCTIRFTLLIEQSQDFWFCLYLAKLVQFFKLGIVACESINTIFIAANQSQ
jgi:hypothetical protein